MKGKGQKYECQECGLVVTVDNACSCDSCELICCNEPMQPMEPEKPGKASDKPVKAKA